MAAQEMEKLEGDTEVDVKELKAEVKELKEMKDAFAKELGELKGEVEELKKFKELYHKELTVAKDPKGSKRSPKLPIQLHDFTGEKGPYSAEEAVRWLRKFRIAARENEWDAMQTFEMASIYLKGRAARWFEFVEEELLAALSNKEKETDWWNLFDVQFKERFADFDPPNTSARMLHTQRMKDMELERGQDVRDHAERFASENRRLNPPIADPYLAMEFHASLGMKRLHLYVDTHTSFRDVVEMAHGYQIEQSLSHRFQMDPSLSHTR